MIPQLRPRELADWFSRAQDGHQAVVLDVREPIELRAASVNEGDFRLLAIPMASIPARLGELDRNAPIACLCHHGGRSMQVARYLHSRGFAQVANIAGGINAWTDELDSSVPRY